MGLPIFLCEGEGSMVKFFSLKSIETLLAFDTAFAKSLRSLACHVYDSHLYFSIFVKSWYGWCWLNYYDWLSDWLDDWLFVWLINVRSIWSQVDTGCRCGFPVLPYNWLKPDLEISPCCCSRQFASPFSEKKRSKKRDEDKECGPMFSNYLRRYSAAAASATRA